VAISSLLELSVLILIPILCETFMPFVSQDRRPIIERDYFIPSDLGWQLRPNLQVVLRRYDGSSQLPYFTTDEHGFRITPAHPGAATGAILGDSLVQGYFLFDDETVPTRVAELTGSNVINAGVGGYSTDQELMVLEKIVKDKALQWAVVVFFPNDLPYNSENEAWGLSKPHFRLLDGRFDFHDVVYPEPHAANAVEPSSIICCSYDANRKRDNIRRNFKRLFFSLPHPVQFYRELRRQVSLPLLPLGVKLYGHQLPDTFYSNPETLTYQWDLAFQLLRRMQEVAEEHSFPLLIVYLPEIAQILNRTAVDSASLPQQYFMQKCLANNLHCADATTVFVKARRKYLLYVADDGHLSPSGASLLARLIADDLYGLRK
jgi:lysophospholipase L1-like esterase